MQPESGSSAAGAGVRAERASGADLGNALLARVAELEELLQAIPIASDEKALKELRRTVEEQAKRDPKFEERVTNRVDTVADRVETVAKTVSTTSAALAAKDGEIAQLRRELGAQAARLEAALREPPGGRDNGTLAELQRAVALLSDQRLPRDIVDRVDDLGAKTGLLAERVDTVSSTASTAAAGLARRDGELVALRERVETESARIAQELEALRRAMDSAPVTELRQALADLAGRTAASQRASEQSVVELRAAAETLGARLESLGSAVKAATARTAEGEEQLTEMSTRVEAEAARQAAAAEALEQSIGALASRLATEADRSTQSAEAVEERLVGLGARVANLGSRLDSLGATVAKTSDALAQQDVGLDELRRELQDGRERVDGLVRDLMQALEDFPGDALPGLEARLDEVVGEVRGLAGRLQQAEQNSLERADEASAAVERALTRLESDVADVRSSATAAARSVEQRLDAAEQEQEALAAGLARATADRELAQATSDDLAARLDSLVATVATTSDALAQQDVGLDELRRELQDGRERVDGLVRDLMQALEDFPGDALPGLEARLDEVVGEVRGLAGRLEQAEDRKELDGLEARLDEIVGDVRGLAGRLERAEDRTELHDLEARLSALDAAHAATTEGLRERDVRLDALRSEIESRVDSLARDTEDETTRAVAQASDEFGRRTDELGDRIAAADEERGHAKTEIARLKGILEVERASVRRRLETLAEAVEATSATTGASELERQLAGLAARFDALESERAVWTESLDRLSTTFEADRASVQGQLDALADALLAPAPAEPGLARSAALESRLNELGRRLDEIERRDGAIASAVSNVTTLWPTALRTLEARIDAIASRVAGPEDPPAEGAAQLVASDAANLDREHEDEGAPSGEPVELAPATIGGNVFPLHGDP